ncbi:MAG: ATP-dependent DNA helicase RecG [Spirochaetaceae bacterium]|nr:ATP-dependent DNA helicase RecG [Spirochaetaceae bacterium]
MKIAEIQVPVSTLSGVGPNTAALFARLNIFTVADLLSTYPREYDDRTKRAPICDFAKSKIHTIVEIKAHEWFGYGRMKTLKLVVSDGTAEAELVAFNRGFLEKSLPVGSIAAVTGKFELKYGKIQSTSFEVQRLFLPNEKTLEESESLIIPDSGLFSVYPLTEGLSQKTLRKLIKQALKQYSLGIDDEIPEEFRQKRNLLHKKDAIIKIHLPSQISDTEEARRTLIYEELFSFQLSMAKRAFEHRGNLPDEQFSESETETQPPLSKEDFEKSLSPLQKKLLGTLPFSLTEDQMRVVFDMDNDIDAGFSSRNTELLKPKNEKSARIVTMQRLLQGDVGSGKTLVAFFVCLRVVDWGGQCVLMAPTELLARQHAENAANLLESLDVSVAFLTGNLKAKERGNLLKAIENGTVKLVVGTHAVFSKSVVYKDLQLAIIDEQHKFGVAQRNSILDKGRQSIAAQKDGRQNLFTPHLLMMSATPIPQSLALTSFGDLDISTIRTMPGGRKPIQTYLTKMGNEMNVYNAVRKELDAGHQAYFVYPRIESGEERAESVEDARQTLKSAENMFQVLSEQIYPDVKCALVHSSVDEEEQNKILNDFKDGKIKILVATTVVEVGVDVANATCMVIEHADRFGLAALHQLRGRVGRSSLQSYCYLIYGQHISEIGVQRMKVLRQSTDGFKIAEEDLRLRGPGEFSGTAQSGYLTFALADITRDREVLLQARTDAFNLLRQRMTQDGLL